MASKEPPRKVPRRRRKSVMQCVEECTPDFHEEGLGVDEMPF